jgi:intein-encoded DNA endonuclease-like protein
MSKNVSGADNPQGSPLIPINRDYDPSETTRRAPSTKGEIVAYLNGAAHDASLNKGNRIRFVQKEKEWLETLQSFLKKINCNSWIYKEGKERNLFALETLCKEIDFVFNPSNLCIKEKSFYVKGFFDADGGIPRNGKRFYIQFAQKSYEKIEWIKNILKELGINCGRIHNPSKDVNPNYWRIFVRIESHKKFAKVVGSLHPIKSAILVVRMVI